MLSWYYSECIGCEWTRANILACETRWQGRTELASILMRVKYHEKVVKSNKPTFSLQRTLKNNFYALTGTLDVLCNFCSQIRNDLGSPEEGFSSLGIDTQRHQALWTLNSFEGNQSVKNVLSKGFFMRKNLKQWRN